MPAKQLIPVKHDADEHYRYKMPMIAARTQSSGNGIKTSFLNPKLIAQAIGRSTASLSQWFGYSIGVQAKLVQNQTQIVLNGSHDNKVLLEKLYEFIDTFVLCPVCHNPETNLYKEGKKLHLHCNSCGNNSEVNSSRGNAFDRMATWFLSHLETESNAPSIATTSTSTSKASKPSLQASGSKTVKLSAEDGKVDGEEGGGVYLNVDELEGILSTLGETIKEPTKKEMDSFFIKMKEMLQADPESVSDISIYNEIQDYQQKWITKESWLIQVIFYALFEDKPNDMLELIKKRRNFLILFLVKESDQKGFLSVLTKFICYDHEELMTSAPIIFYNLFDNEIIEQSAFQLWLTSKPTKAFEPDKKKSENLRNVILKDFFKWLSEAQYEEEIPEENPDECKEEEADENSDIDIDAI